MTMNAASLFKTSDSNRQGLSARPTHAFVDTTNYVLVQGRRFSSTWTYSRRQFTETSADMHTFPPEDFNRTAIFKTRGRKHCLHPSRGRCHRDSLTNMYAIYSDGGASVSSVFHRPTRTLTLTARLQTPTGTLVCGWVHGYCAAATWDAPQQRQEKQFTCMDVRSTTPSSSSSLASSFPRANWDDNSTNGDRQYLFLVVNTVRERIFEKIVRFCTMLIKTSPSS